MVSVNSQNTVNQAPTIAALKDIHLSTVQPRRYFDPQSHQKLIQSIKTHGILQPLLVRPMTTGGYELIAGERRYRAAVAAALTEVPVFIRQLTDSEAVEVALLENLIREELNPLEETEGILHLLAIRLNRAVEEIPLILHQLQHQHKKRTSRASNTNNIIESEKELEADQKKSTLSIIENVFTSLQLMSWTSFANNRLPLLNLPNDVLEALRSARIEYTKAKAIAQLKDQAQRQQLLEQAIAQQWSLNRIKEQVKAFQSQPTVMPLKQRVNRTYQQLKQTKLWENPEKQRKLETLLTELEILLQDK
jgi:ParB family transcriptional regulator, chromosome partitioning protein